MTMIAHLIRPLALPLLLATTAFANPDDFREKFADPETRATALELLIPGTRDHYFHTALDHQLAGRHAEFRETLAAWKNAAETTRDFSTVGLAMLENRDLLISYEASPEENLAELTRRLALQFHEARSDDPTVTGEFPTRLDPAEIGEEAFESIAEQRNRRTPYRAYTGTRLLRELDRLDTFDEAKTRWFLGNIPRADLPQIPALVLRGLTLENPVPFGSVDIHNSLTAAQLTELFEQHPPLRTNLKANLQYLAKSRPGSETDFSRDLRAHADHLAFCRDHALTLPPALNSLKAHILHHHLRLQAELGNFPLDDLLAYLALPRAQHPILRVPQNPAHPIDINADFRDATGCRPYGGDSALIEAQLHHHLADTDAPPAELAALIDEEKLTRIHARARLLAGAEPARWAAALGPTAYQELLEKSHIHFPPGSPHILGANDDVRLALDLKNTRELVIRIHELDVPAHVARHRKQPDVQITLDGLVPHHERRLTFDDIAPIVQHRQTLAFPELDGPGAWIIDFVSGSVSARALVRKGDLTTHLQRTADGQLLHIFDCAGNPVANATLTLGAETFTTDAAGSIHIPNASGQPTTRGHIRAGKLAAPVDLNSREDFLTLDLRAHLDREQILADTATRVLLRPQLKNYVQSLPLDRLENPTLTLKASLPGDVTIERVIAEDLTLTPTLEVPFQVPADVIELTLTLRATIIPATGIDPVRLSAFTTWRPNTNVRSHQIPAAFFSPTDDGHLLEILGRNGEPIAHQVVPLEFHRDGYPQSIFLQLRTDETGRIHLGTLDGIREIRARNPEATYHPTRQQTAPARLIHQTTGHDIRIPLITPTDAPHRHHASLLENNREKNALRDHFEKLTIEDGALVIRDLPPGDYTLTQGDHRTHIAISAGTRHGDLLVSPVRILPHHAPSQPAIRQAAVEDQEILIRLDGHGPATRVTVVGSHFAHHGWAPGLGIFPFAPPLADSLTRGFQTCAYITDRRLSDEMRYIHDRRNATTFPGSLLPRPGTLLHRWAKEEIQHQHRSGRDAVEGRPTEESERTPQFFGTPTDLASKRSGTTSASICDFLAHPATVRFELTPDDDGTVRLPAADFRHARFIHITAADAHASDARVVTLPATDTPLRDRRLARPLDPATPHVPTQRATVLAKDDTATIENLLDADWRAFATLADAHNLLYGLHPDARLRDFVFITEWPTIPEARKLELLHQHACHELHLFLARRDRPFFDAHVRPLLQEKPAPTFIDDLLLERDLTRYLTPFQWRKLNAAEKALLARALPDARERILGDLRHRWDATPPDPFGAAHLFTRTLRGTELDVEDTLGLARANLRESIDSPGSPGTVYVQEKLNRIIIPSINFEDITVEEAIDFLRQRVRELDVMETDPDRKGMGFVIRSPRSGRGGNLGALHIRELRLRNVPLAIALQYVCDQAGLRYQVTDRGIVLSPATDSGTMAYENVATRTFRVPPDFKSIISPTIRGSAPDLDPFAPPQEAGLLPSTLESLSIKELLQNAGVNFGEGSRAILTANGTLIVTNTPLELEKVEGLTEMAGSSGASYAMGFAGELRTDEGGAGGGGIDPFAAPSRTSAIQAPPAPTPTGPTRRWLESNYHRHFGPSDETLIPLNPFWLDLAAWDGEGPFLSPHFNACHATHNEALMCLALLDLPFTAPRPEAAVDGNTLRVKARQPAILFHKDVRRADAPAVAAPLLARQSFTPADQRSRTVDGLEVENTVTGDFRPGTTYHMSLVVTNPTPTPRVIDLLAQIPAGAIPLGGSSATHTTSEFLGPNEVVRSSLTFYFPESGEFAVHPFTVSADGEILARTEPRTLRVVPFDPETDILGESWSDVLFDGNDAEILARLRTENLHAIDVAAIRHHLPDRDFFLQATAILRERLHHQHEVTKWGFHHNDPASIREYLENSEAVTQLGHWLDSPLLEIRPRIHRDWESFDFDPLVNPRAHAFGDHPRLTHPEAHAHYQAYLDTLAWKPALDAEDHLTLATFLFLQDRTADALDRFAKIDPDALTSRLHYDYLHTVALFHQSQPEAAAEIANRRLPTLPPGPWHDRFQTVATQAEEIAALNTPGQSIDEEQTPATPTPTLELTRGDAGKVVIKHRHLDQATLRLFSVDLEVLFSKDPFLDESDGSSAEPAILPNHILEVPLAADVSETTIQLPEHLRRGNLLVSATAGDARMLRILDSNALEIRPIPATRTLRITDAATGRPLPKTYVKIYIETHDRQVHFHKDGHTDLRGLIDHLTHPSRPLTDIRRIAILAHHPDHGATTHIITP